MDGWMDGWPGTATVAIAQWWLVASTVKTASTSSQQCSDWEFRRRLVGATAAQVSPAGRFLTDKGKRVVFTIEFDDDVLQYSVRF